MHFKNYKVNTVILVGLLIATSFISYGVYRYYSSYTVKSSQNLTVTESVGPCPDSVKLIQETRIDASSGSFLNPIHYFPGIAQVLSGSMDGKLAGFLWSDSSQRSELQAVYQIDPIEGSAVKIIEPSPGYEVSSLALGDNWTVWVEQNKKEWKLYSLGITTKQKQLLDEGTYFKETGSDYPSVSLYNDMLVYNISLPSKIDVMVSRIIARNLRTGDTKILHEVSGASQYLGAPCIYENNVVWHRGDWTKDMKAEVYLYDLNSDMRSQISSGDPAITPAIWGRYVVWCSYKQKTPEIKNVVLYNLFTGRAFNLTDSSPINYQECWRPTICHGFITWNTNILHYKPTFYMLEPRTTDDLAYHSDNVKKVDEEGDQSGVYGSWMTWHSPSKGKGIFIEGMCFANADLTGLAPKVAITKTPLSLDNSLTNIQLTGLKPPETVALWYEICYQKRYDLMEKMMAENSDYSFGFTNKEVIEDMKKENAKSPPVKRPYILSRDYLVIGNSATVCDYNFYFDTTEVNKMTYLFLNKEQGCWKVDQALNGN